MALAKPLVEAYWVGHDVAARFGGRRGDLGRIPEVFPVDVVKLGFFDLRSEDGVAVGPDPWPVGDWAEGVAQLRATGVKVSASIGGRDYPGWSGIRDPKRFAAEARQLVD